MNRVNFGSVKVFFIFILCVFLTGVAYTQASYKYKVTVPTDYISKELLSQATDNVPNLGRYIHDEGFEVVLPNQFAESYVRSIFETVGIPVIKVTGEKAFVQILHEKAGGNNCEAAQILCSNTTQTANSSGAGNNELTNSNKGCLSTEHQSSWYYVNIQSGGSLTMTIDPSNNSDDYDFAIWGPFTATTANANCPPVSAPIRCSWAQGGGNTGMMVPYNGQTSSIGCGILWLQPCTGLITTHNNAVDNSEDAYGDGWVRNLTTSAGQIYILLVDNFSNSGQPYTMSFGGSSVLGCTPVVLPVELASFSAERTSNGNILKWTTETENRADYFTVEWTTNPASSQWSEIARVNAAGTSDISQQYSAYHSNPATDKTNYYRLSLTDLDGAKKVYDYHLLSVDNLLPMKKVERVVNLMGQEVSDDTKGIVIYHYTDGTSQKVYR